MLLEPATASSGCESDSIGMSGMPTSFGVPPKEDLRLQQIQRDEQLKMVPRVPTITNHFLFHKPFQVKLGELH